MNTKKMLFAVALCGLLPACAYRSSSSLDYEAAKLINPGPEIKIYEGDYPNKKYQTIAVIEVSVKKTTIFNADPTKEQANKELIEKAKLIGADAVINVTYDTGVGLTTWGYIDAKGTGIKLINP